MDKEKYDRIIDDVEVRRSTYDFQPMMALCLAEQQEHDRRVRLQHRREQRERCQSARNEIWFMLSVGHR